MMVTKAKAKSRGETGREPSIRSSRHGVKLPRQRCDSRFHAASKAQANQRDTRYLSPNPRFMKAAISFRANHLQEEWWAGHDSSSPPFRSVSDTSPRLARFVGGDLAVMPSLSHESILLGPDHTCEAQGTQPGARAVPEDGAVRTKHQARKQGWLSEEGKADRCSQGSTIAYLMPNGADHSQSFHSPGTSLISQEPLTLMSKTLDRLQRRLLSALSRILSHSATRLCATVSGLNRFH
ncbi:hypothetical protein HDV57DRAFT_430584 [Trichoderma longibrachiatum]